MSLGINATTAEGLVLAADSRQTYINQKHVSRIGSDSATKIFKISERVGLVFAGLAFLPENGTPKNISIFIEDFVSENKTEKMSVKEIADALSIFFGEKYQWQKDLDNLYQQIEVDLKNKGLELVEMIKKKYHFEFKFKDKNGIIGQGGGGVNQLQFALSGYNLDGSQVGYMINIPSDGPQESRSSEKVEKKYGANWIGQIDMVSRIVLGFDGRIGNLPFVQKMTAEIGQEEVQKQLHSLEYVIQWGTMTLQDAIDFCKLSIETTTAIQRFSDGIQGDPGDISGVGGPVDIAVITPKKGFVWVSKKNLKIGDKEIDLDDFEDLKITKEKK